MGEMTKKDWEGEYARLLEKALESGEVQPLDKAHEKRTQPRFHLGSGSIWIRVEQSFDVLDVSVNGLAFLSEKSFTPGQNVAISLGKAFLVESVVVDCRMVETDEGMMEAMYRISCEFEDTQSGQQALILLKEMEEPEVLVGEHIS